MIAHIPIWLAFAAGIISFISPCVLPLVPAYLGVMAQHGSVQGKSSRLHAINRGLFFVLGFALVFVGLGALAGFLGFYLLREMPWLFAAAGAVIIFFGVYMVFTAFLPQFNAPWILRLNFFYREWHLPLRGSTPLILGVSFGLGWTPCIGPVLGGVLALAYSSSTALSGAVLLAVYSAGLGIPFLLAALFAEQLRAAVKRLRRVYFILQVGFGVILIATGALIATNELARLSGWFFQLFPFTGPSL